MPSYHGCKSREAAVCYESDELTSEGSLTSGARAATLQRPDGTAIAYDVAGEGPPVVFVHGLTNRRQAWDPVTELLAQHVTCVRVDLRGHGASSAAPEYSMLSLVGDMRAVVEQLALSDPAVVGHSLGGQSPPSTPPRTGHAPSSALTSRFGLATSPPSCSPKRTCCGASAPWRW